MWRWWPSSRCSAWLSYAVWICHSCRHWIYLSCLVFCDFGFLWDFYEDDIAEEWSFNLQAAQVCHDCNLPSPLANSISRIPKNFLEAKGFIFSLQKGGVSKFYRSHEFCRGLEDLDFGFLEPVFVTWRARCWSRFSCTLIRKWLCADAGSRKDSMRCSNPSFCSATRIWWWFGSTHTTDIKMVLGFSFLM